jgi:hypothetical protein
VYIDAQLIRVFNARGSGREWLSLDKVAGWLREQGFWYWWTRNDLEPLGSAEGIANPDEDDEFPTLVESIPSFSRD